MLQGYPSAAVANVVCEVCETPQWPAADCAECGMPLKLPPGVLPVADPAVEQLPGLERTEFEAVPELPLARVPGVEVTVAAPVGDVPVEYMLEFEPTAVEALDWGAPAPELVPDLERTAEPFERTAPPVASNPVACPYCGFAQASGRICNNCGRSKTRYLPTPPEASDEDAPVVRCLNCGNSVKQQKLCSECGAALPGEGLRL